jgi:hypothetical protein
MAALGILTSANLNGGQKLAVKYFTVAIALFGAQVLFGVLAGLQYLYPDFLFGILDFSVNRMLHVNAMVVWLLFGFIGSVYWMLEDESGIPVVGLGLGNLIFWIFTLAVVVVVLVYLLVQVGPGEQSSIWLINEGREYIEAPRWADIGIVVCVLAFFYNVAGTFAKGKFTNIGGVLVMDLIALAGLYLAGMYYTPNISMDQHWWWWVIHLWVEATWEVLVGCLMAYGLIKTMGVRRKIVETWLYIEVALMFGSGILGLGHHYFWIGTPEYWFTIGGFFSALEPIPLVAMVVHAVFDAGHPQAEEQQQPGAGLDHRAGLRQLLRRWRLGFHAYLAADQPVYPRHTMDCVARSPGVLWRLCHDGHRLLLHGDPEMARRCLDERQPGRRLEVEMGDLPAPCRHDHDGHGPADFRLRTVANRTRGGRMPATSPLGGESPLHTRQGEVLAERQGCRGRLRI